MSLGINGSVCTTVCSEIRGSNPLTIGLALISLQLVEAFTEVNGTNQLGYEEPRPSANSRRRLSVTKRLSINAPHESRRLFGGANSTPHSHVDGHTQRHGEFISMVSLR